ncbi:MAG: (Fe-S)-binding protein [Nitrososphaerota archaeon]|nr:(Fe-S)-binding protein [Candidatus Bathyarchaeota archaeon]MDW8022851.1 (Fe-S)-binding protein [Nitrososphaerota archaeon]
MGLEKYRRDVMCCTRCGFCKVIFGPVQKSWRFNIACPIHKYYGFDAYSGQGMLFIAQKILNGKLGYTDKLIKLLYSCATCGYCDYACKWVHANAEVLDIILELRAKAVEDEMGPLPQHKRMAENIAKHGNIYGKPREERFSWMPEGTKTSEKADIVYFAGCTTAYLKPEIAQATVKILNAANVSFTTLGVDEQCCGSSLWRTGQRENAQKLMKHNVSAIGKTGASTLLVSCAHCYGTFKREYPKVVGKLNFEVLHVSELVNRLISEGKLKLTRKVDVKVTYHDSCLLGRLGETYIPWEGQIKRFGVFDPPKTWLFGSKGTYAPPRKVLKAIPGVELVEMERIKEYAWCCGAGPDVRHAYPDLTLFTAKERIEEAKTTSAEAIVSCCPHCAINFENAIANGKESIKYYDLTELVLQALSK